MYYRRNDAPAIPSGQPDDTFHLYFRTEPVVIIYGDGRRLHANEDNNARRIMKLLDWLGKESIPVRGVMRGRCVLDHSSLRALNCYLRHGEGLTAFRRSHPHAMPFHRFGWSDLEQLIGLRWVRHV